MEVSNATQTHGLEKQKACNYTELHVWFHIYQNPFHLLQLPIFKKFKEMKVGFFVPSENWAAP